MKLLRALDAALAAISRKLSELAGLVLIAIAILVCVDITFRNLDASLIGIFEIVQVMFVIACFLGFAFTHLSDREIRIDALRLNLRGRLGFLADLIGASVVLAFFGLLLWYGAERWYRAWSIDDFMGGRLLIPTTIPWGAIVLGALFATLVALRTFLISLTKLLLGTERRER